MRCLKNANLLLGILLFSLHSHAQTRESQDDAYRKVVTQRADKIVTTLQLTDSTRSSQVRDVIAQQYFQLNRVQSAHDSLVKEIKKDAVSDKTVADTRLRTLEDETTNRLDGLHKKYLSSLGSLLTPDQVAQVKDGMTYGVLPITYKGYLAMLPNLTQPQKDQLMAWLVEAREHAMDAGTSEAKHAWFGKYKGRINNYLSAQGFNMKQASDDYAKKIKEEAAAKNQ